MDEVKSRLEVREDQEIALRTYLRDRTAGAQHALALLKALGEVHAGTFLGDFADDQFQQVRADLDVLEHLASTACADHYQLKEAAGWLAGR